MIQKNSYLMLCFCVPVSNLVHSSTSSMRGNCPIVSPCTVSITPSLRFKVIQGQRIKVMCSEILTRSITICGVVVLGSQGGFLLWTGAGTQRSSDGVTKRAVLCRLLQEAPHQKTVLSRDYLHGCGSIGRHAELGRCGWES